MAYDTLSRQILDSPLLSSQMRQNRRMSLDDPEDSGRAAVTNSSVTLARSEELGQRIAEPPCHGDINKNAPFPIEKLPAELILEIVDQLEPKDLLECRLTGRNLSRHCETKFKEVLSPALVEWSCAGLELFKTRVEELRPAQLVTELWFKITELDPYLAVEEARYMRTQYEWAMSRLQGVHTIVIDIKPDFSGQSEERLILLRQCLQDLIMIIIKSILSFFDKVPGQLHGLRIVCDTPEYLGTRLDDQIPFANLTKSFPGIFGSLTLLDIALLKNPSPTNDMLSLFGCLSSVEYLQLGSDNLDLLYNSQFQHILFPALRSLQARLSYEQTTENVNSHPRIRLNNLLSFLQRHSKTLKSVSIGHHGSRSSWLMPSGASMFEVWRHLAEESTGSPSTVVELAENVSARELWTYLPSSQVRLTPAVRYELKAAAKAIELEAIRESREKQVQLGSELDQGRYKGPLSQEGIIKVGMRTRNRYRRHISTLIEGEFYPLSCRDLLEQLTHTPEGSPCDEFFDYLRRGCPFENFEVYFEEEQDVYNMETGGLFCHIRQTRRDFDLGMQQDIDEFEN
ncbi:hypothetical protein FKW77_002373 [Venturia effusa]|uniref:F-box domain-containing protein n=1 Tax=Venturia effusa TaxID=50376 RepID=A0A517LAI0_9PEZI|nr:hypothetical protein FKW77_002373 [Venturia effusa]